jgi:hypothetical protein
METKFGNQIIKGFWQDDELYNVMDYFEFFYFL